MSISWQPSEHKVTQSRPYLGALAPLTREDADWLRGRGFGVLRSCAVMRRAPERHCYALPIYSPTGEARGHVLRRPWAGSPLWSAWVGGTPPLIHAKADTYKSDAGAPLQSWYSWHPELPLVLVEDQLSAIKVASQYGLADAVAFLGVPRGGDCVSGYARVRELSREAVHRPEVIVALDADATQDAFEFVRRWGAAFEHVRVAILEHDLKDTAPADFRRVLGL